MKIKKAIRAVFIFSIAVLAINCETEKLAFDEQADQTKTILSAKTWFEEYESSGKNYELVQNLNYDWQEAKLTKSEDGTPTIIVPVLELKKEERELWEQKLYIYKLDNDKYKALVFEAYSNKNVKRESQSVDRGDFTGYMTVWDLKTGPVRAAKFVNNRLVEEGVAEFSIKRSMTAKAPPDPPCVYADFGDGGCGGLGNGDGPAIPLRSVVVTGPSKGTPVIYTPRFTPPTGGGTTPGSYTSPGGGNSGGGTPPPPAANPCEKIKVLMADPNFIAKLEELKKKTKKKHESGYSQSKNGSFTELTIAPSSGSTDALRINTTADMIGYIHTHLDEYETGQVNMEGDLLTRKPIKMFSPADVGVFLKLVKNAQANNIPIDSVYGVMVSSDGNYQLRFTGDPTQINTNFDWDAETLNKDYVTYMKKGNKEIYFLSFLKDKGYINGIELYKINKDKTSTKKVLDANKKVVNVNC
ncbi:hypothetical protein [Flavobacterium poyangense]|uniref:hypothetical protein n=1 Tax=Flavobacterium poyangense TaxID=2204302 RepID=UPI0014231C2B|nr:hypothetical protein [Flavobacterium sp. JXAS1]